MSEPADPRHPLLGFSPSDWPTPEDAWRALAQWRKMRADYLADQKSWPTGSAGFNAEDFAAERRLDFTVGG